MAKKQVAYLIPIELARAVKREAADRDIYPAHVVEEALREYLDRQTPARKPRTRPSKPTRAAAGA